MSFMPFSVCSIRPSFNNRPTERLKTFNKSLYKDVKIVLNINKEQRHIRGGMATKEKYLKYKKQSPTF